MENSINIVTIGNSITQAASGFNSFRRDLWNLLTQAGYNIDFVGSENRTKDNTSFPDPSFDADHEGHWGWRTDEIINGRSGEGQLADWLLGYTPDIALVHLGSNDALQSNSTVSTVNELNQVIDILRQDNPNVTVFVAQLIPTTGSSANQRINDLNSAIPALVTDKDTSNSRVILVDQNTGFNAFTDTYDGIHPNPSGEAKMAQRWFDALQTYFDSTDTPVNLVFDAIADSASTPVDTAVNISVLANDNISAGIPFTLVAPSATENGTISVNNNGTPTDSYDDFIAYTPNLGFTGTDTFTYTIADGLGGSDTANVTVSVLPNLPPSDRVMAGLLSLYTFDEGSGSTVFDVSGVGTALNLEIGNLGNATWGNGVLNLTAANLITSLQPASKLFNGITATQEITLEAWLAPANTSQSGPARIATLSKDTVNRNFTLGQNGDDYNVRLRTTTTGNNGLNKMLTSPGSEVRTDLTHVVYSREADGDAFMYVDNQLVTTDTITGTFSNWDAGYRFALGSELDGSRSWLGSLDLVAVYNQAFDASEVEQNFLAGSTMV
ncbi:MAG: LamG-like jellyroll fold domain-containing protein [Nodosilinea sp.]